MGILSKYYNIFGLPETASTVEIKRRYRQLVLKYHPDKMGGNQQKFLEIQEAYEYLTGERKVAASTPTSTSRSTSSARNQSVDDRIKRAKQQYKENLYKEYVAKERYFQQLTSGWKWKALTIISKVGAFVAFVLILELFLPYRIENDRIVGSDYRTMSGLTSVGEVRNYYLATGNSIYFEDIPRYLYHTPEILIYKSYIFHNKRKVQFIFSSGKEEFKVQYDWGGHAYLLLPFFLIPLGVVYIQKRTYSYVFFFYLSLYVSSALLLIFFITQDRIAHLLTIGNY